MNTLRELAKNRQEFLNMLEDEETDIDTMQCAIDTIETVDEEFKIKAENYYTIIQQLKSYIQEIKDEEKRLSNRKNILKIELNL